MLTAIRPLLFFSFLVCCAFLRVSAQVNFVWAEALVHEGSTTRPEGMAIDRQKFVLVTGGFSGTCDFDPGPGLYYKTALGVEDVFVSKLDSSGKLVWMKQFGSVSLDQSSSITADVQGNSYVSGTFYETLDFDPGPGVVNLSPKNGVIFVMKLDSDGNLLWVRQYQARSSLTITLDPSDNLLLTGRFSGTQDFDPGPGIYPLSSEFDLEDIYILKLTDQGDFIWARHFHDTSGPAISVPSMEMITVKAGTDQSVYVAGTFARTFDFDPSPASFSLTAEGSLNGFVVKLSKEGSLQWARQLGRGNYSTALSMEVDPDGNVYTTGSFFGPADFDPSASAYTLNGFTPFVQSYISKLNTKGEFVWAKEFVSPNSGGVQTYTLTLDSARNVYTAGFAYQADFDPGPNVYKIADPTYGHFITKLDQHGTFNWAVGFQNTDQTQIVLKTDILKNVYLTSGFHGTVDFDPGPDTFILSNEWSSYRDNIYLVKLKQCDNAVSSLDVATCGPYVLNGTTYGTSGAYFQILPKLSGCDSVISLNLQISADVKRVSMTSCGAYTWHGAELSTSGTYRDTLVTQNGCDSVVELSLTINRQASSTVSLTPYEGESYGGHSMTGTYIDTLTAANGCDSVRTLNLIVRKRVVITLNTFVCEGETYQGHATSGVYRDTVQTQNGIDSVRILILTVHPVSVTTFTPSICEGETYFAGGSNRYSSGTYRDTLQGYFGCDSILVTNLTVKAKPLVDLGEDRNLCLGSDITLSPGSFARYSWQDGSTASMYTVRDTGLYWVRVSNAPDCFASDSMRVAQKFNSPKGFLHTSDSICVYQELQLSSQTAFPSYLWSTGTTGASVLVDRPGTYSLSVIDANGCTATEYIVVVPRQCTASVYVPNAFSPNGDGKNDLFKPVVSGSLVRYRFTVFNRWGEMVFSSTETGQGWDGKIKGQPSETASFVWQCQYQFAGEKATTIKGTVTLVK